MTPTSVALVWSPVNDPNVTGYDIIRNGQFLASVSSGVTYTDTAVTSGLTYSYNVESVNSSGQFSPPSVPTVNAVPPYSSTVLGYTPLGYWRLGETSTSSPAADASGNNNAGTYHGSVTLGASGALVNDSDTAATVDGSTAYVGVAASSALNPTSFTASVIADWNGQNPSGYQNVFSSYEVGAGWTILREPDGYWHAIVNGASSSLDLGGFAATANVWTHRSLTYNASNGAVSFYVNGVLAAGGTFTSYVPNTTAPIRIGAAADSNGNTAYFFSGSIDEAAIFGAVLTQTQLTSLYAAAVDPLPVTELAATAASDTQINLSWANSSVNVSGIQIARSSDGIHYSVIANLSGQATSYSDSGLTSGAPYSYEVITNTVAGLSTFSQVGSATIAAVTQLTATAVSTSEIDLTWSDQSRIATGLEVERSADGAHYTTVATLSASATSYADTGLPEATGYFYDVLPVAGSVIAPAVALVDTITFPAAPSALTAAASATDISLSWTDNSQNDDGFEIFRSTDGTSFSLIDSVPARVTSYEDLDAPYGGTDYYYVKAVTAGGESSASNTASAPLIAKIQLTEDTPATGVTYQVNHGKTLTVTNPSLLANDVDPNGITATIASHTSPAHGTLTLNSDGTFTYVANNNFVGTDTFTYTATDSLGAASNTANVSILVNDSMPQADDVRLVARQAVDGSNNPLPYAASMTGSVRASDAEGDSLTYSIVSGPTSSQGTFTLDSNTGSVTLTPNSSYTGPITVVYKVSDGTLDSNLSSVSYTGYSLSGSTFTPLPQPSARGAGPSTWVYENGTMAISAQNGLLLNAVDNDPSPDPDSLSVDTNLVEGPKHGTITINAADGSFVYQPNPGYTGPDWFTWRVKDGSKESGYTSWYISVQPLPISLSFDNLAPGDPTAQIYPGPAGSNAPQSFSELHINNMPGQLGDVLTISADEASAVNVFSGAPGVQGTVELFGHDQNTSSYAWTINPNSPPPATLYVVGVTPSDYQQIVFHLSYTPAQQDVNGYALSSPVTAPATTPLAATQKATVPGKGGYLVAFDGTWEFPTMPGGPTDIYQFASAYQGTKFDYHGGVGNAQDHPVNINPLTWPNLLVRGWSGAFGGFEASAIVNNAIYNARVFYAAPSNRGIPLDSIGLSRGAFESAKFVNLLTQGFMTLPSKDTKWVQSSQGWTRLTIYNPPAQYWPWTRFVGLISPVNQMGPVSGGWPTSLPTGVGALYEAGDKNPGDPIYLETYIAPAAGTHLTFTRYDLTHRQIGWSTPVLNDMKRAARAAGVPV